MVDKKRILLAVPVYSEQKHLTAVLDKVRRYIDDVLVIDDGSTDDSKVILAKRKDICFLSHECNLGYGRSMIDIFFYARGVGYDWVITMDCDFQHEPAQIPDFLAAIDDDNADVVSGSRYLNSCGCRCDVPRDRRHINMEISKLISSRLGLELTDAFCGFKAYRVQSLAKLTLSQAGYAFPLEFWVQAVYNNLCVREIPVSLIYNDPDRHFGGNLDDAIIRLDHYKDVFERSSKKVTSECKL